MKTSGPMKVLIADNDRAFVRQCCETFAERSFITEVRIAYSGTQCMNILKTFTPNVIFLGVDLDRMNGLVTARFIRSRYVRFSLFYLADKIPPFFQNKMEVGIVDGFFSKSQFTNIIADAAAFKSITSL